MKAFKKHKQEFILLFIILGLFLIMGIAILVLWFSGSDNVYGDRLNGIEKVTLSEKYMGDKASTIKEIDYVEKVTYDIKGKLVSFIVTVKNDTKLDLAKNIGNVIIKEFSEEELAFYDFQLYLIDSKEVEEPKEGEEKVKKDFPAIGYKHRSSEEFVW